MYRRQENFFLVLGTTSIIYILYYATHFIKLLNIVHNTILRKKYSTSKHEIKEFTKVFDVI